MLRQIDDFHKTPIGYVTFAVVELAFAYIFGIRAIDTANMWYYAITILLVVGVINNVVQLIVQHTEFVHHKPNAKAKQHHSHKKA